MKEKIDIYSALFRDLEAEIGTRDLSDLVMESLAKSIMGFRGDAMDFYNQFETLCHVVLNTEPKFGILNYRFSRLLGSYHKNLHKNPLLIKWRKFAIKEIKDILKNSKIQGDRLIKNSEKVKVSGKTILIHDHSHTVQDVLTHLKRKGKKFRVIIAEQDFDKTHSNIERMHNAGIPFQVVPAYMLSHVHDRIDMLFFGALTLKDNMNFVMDPGTHGIITEFHTAKIPVYMFIDTRKFSMWKSNKRTGVFIHKHLREHHSKPIVYERIKYSHDRVPAELFEQVVTNEGVFSAKELEKVFKKKMKGL